MHSKNTVVVALFLGALLIPASGTAGMVDHSSQGIVAFHSHEAAQQGAEGFVLMANGSVWQYDVNHIPPIHQLPREHISPSPPVPVSDIKWWSPNGIITFSGEIQTYDWSGTSGTYEWRSLGTVPGGPISTDQQDVGSMKSKFAPQQSNDQ